MPPDFDAEFFDVGEANDAIADEPTPDTWRTLGRWRPEVALPLTKGVMRGGMVLKSLIDQAAGAAEELDAEGAARAAFRYQLLLRTVGDGVKLTQAGYLPPRIVEELFGQLEMGDHWYGKGNREDQTAPIFRLRESATQLGLLRKSRGTLTVTKVGRAVRDDPAALLAHVADRLPLGREAERDAGIVALLIAAAGLDKWEARQQAGEAFAELGWTVTSGDQAMAWFHTAAPTQFALAQLVGRDSAPAPTTAVLARLLRRP